MKYRYSVRRLANGKTGVFDREKLIKSFDDELAAHRFVQEILQ